MNGTTTRPINTTAYDEDAGRCSVRISMWPASMLAKRRTLSETIRINWLMHLER